MGNSWRKHPLNLSEVEFILTLQVRNDNFRLQTKGANVTPFWDSVPLKVCR
jgi:hypothetical protein